MRVTQQMMSQQFIRNLHKNNQAMATTNAQISSGKKYEKISDNPQEVLKALSHQSSIMKIEQYQKNAQDGADVMQAIDDALQGLTNVMHRIRELTVKGSNDTANASDKKDIAQEIRSLQQQVNNIANTTLGDRYLFSRTNYTAPPYSEGEWQTGQDALHWNIGQAVNVTVNVNADTVFGFPVDGKNLIDTIGSIAETLENGENPNALLTSIDEQMENLLSQNVIIGTNQNLLESAINKLDQASFLQTKMLSDAEDTNIAKAFTDLSLQEAAIQGSLQASGRMIQLSLVNFLR